MTTQASKPIVLAVGGHDPCGGAGIQADIETLAALGCHAMTLITALTSQNTCRVGRIIPQATQQLEMQFRLLLQEGPIAAIKIGMVGNASMADLLARLLGEYPEIPVVLDPVLASGSGSDLGDEDLPPALVKHLIPCCTLTTPNSVEARKLGGEQDLDLCAQRLVSLGSAAVLITGAHEADADVVNRLYGLGGVLKSWRWPRLEASYHGSGCTLASAVAAGMARGLSLTEAVSQAQAYTWDCLNQGFRSGRCQLTPNRLHRHSQDPEDSPWN